MGFKKFFGIAASDRGPSSKRSEGSTMSSEELQRALHEENQRLMQQVAALQDTSSASSDTHDEPDAKAELSAVEKEIWELKKSLGMLDMNTKADEKHMAGDKLTELKKRIVAVGKGLDICFLVDSTLSMKWCIEEVKTKVQSIIDTISKMHEGSVINVAFVGYSNYDGEAAESDKQYQVQDFLLHSKMDVFQKFVSNTEVAGGDDACEDVAGGLKHALGLKWSSSTRLIIHFCDYPAHGTAYHNLNLVVKNADRWPEGDPDGNKIEDLMQQLCNRRIDYYFAAITQHTAKMARIMKECYAHSHNAQFQIVGWKDADTSFAPLIINSVRSSMQRSAQYDKMWDSAGSKLSCGDREGRSIFHATVG